jgi:hypothetical protein
MHKLPKDWEFYAQWLDRDIRHFSIPLKDIQEYYLTIFQRDYPEEPNLEWHSWDMAHRWICDNQRDFPFTFKQIKKLSTRKTMKSLIRFWNFWTKW